MSWTYSGDPSTTVLDAVRFLIEDTISTAPLLANEEINWVIGQESTTVPANAYLPAITCCKVIAGKYARQPMSRKIGDVDITYGDFGQHYRDLATSLRELALRHSSPVPYAGGISLGDKSTVAGNTDHNAGAFSDPDGFWRNPGVAGGKGGSDGFTRAVP